MKIIFKTLKINIDGEKIVLLTDYTKVFKASKRMPKEYLNSRRGCEIEEEFFQEDEKDGK